MSDQQDPEVPADGYSPDEVRRNRRNILLWTTGFIICFWLMAPPQGAIVLTVMAVGFALICIRLFASRSSTKLGDDFAGSGDRVPPRTMGTILGYLYRGFRND